MARYARIAVPAPMGPLGNLLDYRIPPELEGKIQAGSLVKVSLGRRASWGLVFELSDVSRFDEAKIKAIDSLILADPIFDRARMGFLRALSKHYLHPLGMVCESALPGPIRDGKKLQLKEKKEGVPSAEAIPKKALNPAQQAAVDAVLKSAPGPHLLWGVTGSGKTEVYLELIEALHAEGKSALVLVPEISLTPQLTRRFAERFPGEVAVFHSGQKPTELRQAWLETFLGKKRIAIGARSALFAPLKNLSIIIVDEEHDASYKQEDRLRYHARDAAVRLAELCQIPIVLGSATPSAETLYRSQRGEIRRSLLRERAVGTAQLPQIRRIDLRKLVAEHTKAMRPFSEDENAADISGTPSIRGDFFLSPELRTALSECLADKKQAILFLNRRGVGSQILCKHCGFSFDCPSCDVKLTPHREKLVCHYCAYEQRIPRLCPGCDKNEEPFVHIGIGTAAVEEVLKVHFPEARVLRLDRDSTESRGSLEKIVSDFSQQKADILVGTQMVAKGHDFPDVTLVGILLAELGLSVPDFRAVERNFQLLLQVSGRAGRALAPGKVLVQSFQPEHPSLEALENFRGLEDYESFMNFEIRKRENLLYPPYGKLVLFKFDGLDAARVAEAAHSVAAALKKTEAPDLKVLGPVSSPLAKLRSRYRWQILIKSSSPARLEKSIAWILAGWEEKKLERNFKTRLVIDVDPLQML